MPIKVIDKATQQEIELSSAEAQQGLLKGTLVLPSSSVAIVGPNNEIGDVSPTDLLGALGQGWRMADEDEIGQIKLRREASTIGAQSLGALEAAGAGLTLGLSTAAEEALGADPAAMAARREALGSLGTAAEITGALAPALFTGGASLGASGAARAGAAATRAGLGARVLGATPAGLLARGGAAVERGLGAGLGTGGGLVRTVVPVAGRGMVEGFAAGVGQEIDESVLGEREITAERLLEAGGMGALMGGVAGTVVPGLAYAGTGLGRVAAKPVRGLLSRAAGIADNLPSLDDGISGLIASPRGRETLATMWGVPRAEVDDFFALPAAERTRLFGDRVRMLEDMADEARPVFEGFRATRRMSIEEGSGLSRLMSVRRDLPEAWPTTPDGVARMFEREDMFGAGMLADDLVAPSRSLRSFDDAFRGATPEEVDAIAMGQRRTMSGGSPFEPVTIAYHPGHEGFAPLTLRDGNHRITAARTAGAKRIRANVVMPDDTVIRNVPVRIDGQADEILAKIRQDLPAGQDSLARIQKAAQDQLNAIEAKVTAAEAAASRGEITIDTGDLKAVRGMIRQARMSILREADPVDFGAMATGAMRNEAGQFAGQTTAVTRAVDQRVVAATAFNELDRLKQGVDRLAAANRDSYARSGNRAASGTADLLSDMAGPLRMHLEDATIHGRAGAMQAERNGLMSRARQTRDQLRGASKNVVDPRAPLDNADLLTVMRNGGGWRGATKTENLLDHVGAEADLLEWHLRNSDLDDLTRKAFTEQLEANRKLLDLVEKRQSVVRRADILDRWRAGQTNGSPSDNLLTTAAPFVGGLLGSAVGGIPGAIIGAGIGMATKPYNMARMLSVIEARAGGSADRSLRALSGALGKIRGAATTAGKAIGEGASAAARGVDAAARRAAPVIAGDRSARLETIRATAARLAANPGLLAEEQRKMTIDLDDVAPRLSKAVAMKSAIAVQYLAQHAPKGYAPTLDDGPPMIDPIDLDAYERRVEAVLDPVGTLKRIGDGTLTAEHIDALKAVWPAKYDEAKTRLFEAIAARGKKPLPLDIATQLSAMWEAPVDPTLELAGGIHMAFASGAAAAARQQAPMQGQRSGKPAKLEIDTNRFDTPLDAATKASHA